MFFHSAPGRCAHGSAGSKVVSSVQRKAIRWVCLQVNCGRKSKGTPFSVQLQRNAVVSRNLAEHSKPKPILATSSTKNLQLTAQPQAPGPTPQLLLQKDPSLVYRWVKPSAPRLWMNIHLEAILMLRKEVRLSRFHSD